MNALVSPPPYEESIEQKLSVATVDVAVDDKIKYRIFYRYLNGLRRTFSGPRLYDSYEECLETCNYLNNPAKFRDRDISFDDMVHLYHFPG